MNNNNKILIEIYLPTFEIRYDVFIPINKRVGTIKQLIEKLLIEMSDITYKITEGTNLYSKDTGNIYDVQMLIKDTDIKNGSKLVLI